MDPDLSFKLIQEQNLFSAGPVYSCVPSISGCAQNVYAARLKAGLWTVGDHSFPRYAYKSSRPNYCVQSCLVYIFCLQNLSSEILATLRNSEAIKTAVQICQAHSGKVDRIPNVLFRWVTIGNEVLCFSGSKTVLNPQSPFPEKGVPYDTVLYPHVMS